MDSIEASDPSGFVPAIDEAEATADDMVEGAPLESMPLEGEAAELPAEDEQVDRCFSQGHSARDDKLLDAADAPYDQQPALFPA